VRNTQRGGAEPDLAAVDPTLNPLAVVPALTAMNNSIDFLKEGWTDYKRIANDTVDLWRKPIVGAAIDAVKVRGTIVPSGIGIEGVAALMKNIDIKVKLSKLTPLPIKVIEKLESTTSMVSHSDGSSEEIVVDLFYQENKFPPPFSNRHACFVTCSRRLPDGGYVLVESTVEHEECLRRAGKDGVVWEFVNTIMLESESGKNVTTTVSSKFDIGITKIPKQIINPLIENMAGLFEGLNNLLKHRSPIIIQALEQAQAGAAQLAISTAAAAAPATAADDDAALAGMEPEPDDGDAVDTTAADTTVADADPVNDVPLRINHLIAISGGAGDGAADSAFLYFPIFMKIPYFKILLQCPMFWIDPNLQFRFFEVCGPKTIVKFNRFVYAYMREIENEDVGKWGVGTMFPRYYSNGSPTAPESNEIMMDGVIYNVTMDMETSEFILSNRNEPQLYVVDPHASTYSSILTPKTRPEQTYDDGLYHFDNDRARGGDTDAFKKKLPDKSMPPSWARAPPLSEELSYHERNVRYAVLEYLGKFLQNMGMDKVILKRESGNMQGELIESLRDQVNQYVEKKEDPPEDLLTSLTEALQGLIEPLSKKVNQYVEEKKEPPRELLEKLTNALVELIELLKNQVKNLGEKGEDPPIELLTNLTDAQELQMNTLNPDSAADTLAVKSSEVAVAEAAAAAEAKAAAAEPDPDETEPEPKPKKRYGRKKKSKTEEEKRLEEEEKMLKEKRKIEEQRRKIEEGAKRDLVESELEYQKEVAKKEQDEKNRLELVEKNKQAQIKAAEKLRKGGANIIVDEKYTSFQTGVLLDITCEFFTRMIAKEDDWGELESECDLDGSVFIDTPIKQLLCLGELLVRHEDGDEDFYKGDVFRLPELFDRWENETMYNKIRQNEFWKEYEHDKEATNLAIFNHPLEYRSPSHILRDGKFFKEGLHNLRAHTALLKIMKNPEYMEILELEGLSETPGNLSELLKLGVKLPRGETRVDCFNLDFIRDGEEESSFPVIMEKRLVGGEPIIDASVYRGNKLGYFPPLHENLLDSLIWDGFVEGGYDYGDGLDEFKLRYVKVTEGSTTRIGFCTNSKGVRNGHLRVAYREGCACGGHAEGVHDGLMDLFPLCSRDDMNDYGTTEIDARTSKLERIPYEIDEGELDTISHIASHPLNFYHADNIRKLPNKTNQINYLQENIFQLLINIKLLVDYIGGKRSETFTGKGVDPIELGSDKMFKPLFYELNLILTKDEQQLRFGLDGLIELFREEMLDLDSTEETVELLINKRNKLLQLLRKVSNDHVFTIERKAEIDAELTSKGINIKGEEFEEFSGVKIKSEFAPLKFTIKTEKAYQFATVESSKTWKPFLRNIFGWQFPKKWGGGCTVCGVRSALPYCIKSLRCLECVAAFTSFDVPNISVLNPLHTDHAFIKYFNFWELLQDPEAQVMGQIKSLFATFENVKSRAKLVEDPHLLRPYCEELFKEIRAAEEELQKVTFGDNSYLSVVQKIKEFNKAHYLVSDMFTVAIDFASIVSYELYETLVLLKEEINETIGLDQFGKIADCQIALYAAFLGPDFTLGEVFEHSMRGKIKLSTGLGVAAAAAAGRKMLKGKDKELTPEGQEKLTPEIRLNKEEALEKRKLILSGQERDDDYGYSSLLNLHTSLMRATPGGTLLLPPGGSVNYICWGCGTELKADVFCIKSLLCGQCQKKMQEEKGFLLTLTNGPLIRGNDRGLTLTGSEFLEDSTFQMKEPFKVKEILGVKEPEPEPEDSYKGKKYKFVVQSTLNRGPGLDSGALGRIIQIDEIVTIIESMEVEDQIHVKVELNDGIKGWTSINGILEPVLEPTQAPALDPAGDILEYLSFRQNNLLLGAQEPTQAPA